MFTVISTEPWFAEQTNPEPINTYTLYVEVNPEVMSTVEAPLVAVTEDTKVNALVLGVAHVGALDPLLCKICPADPAAVEA